MIDRWANFSRDHFQQLKFKMPICDLEPFGMTPWALNALGHFEEKKSSAVI